MMFSSRQPDGQRKSSLPSLSSTFFQRVGMLAFFVVRKSAEAQPAIGERFQKLEGGFMPSAVCDMNPVLLG